MGLIRGIQVGFREVYPQETPPTVAQLLNGISRSKFLLLASGILAELFKGQTTAEVLGNWFRAENKEFAEDALVRLKPIEDEVKRILIASTPAALKLYSYALNNLTETQTQSDAETEKSIFKAFLVQHDELNKTDDLVTATTEKLEFDLRLAGHYFASSVRFNDLVVYDLNELFVSEFIRAVLFFEFLDQDTQAKPLLNAFCNAYDAAGWKDFLARLSAISAQILKKTKAGHLELSISAGPNYERDCKFLDSLSTVEYDELKDSDFKALREKPLHKIEKGRYRIIFGLFCVERIFKGLYFNLKSINLLLPAKDKVKDIRKLYTYEFSEQEALYTLLRRACPKKWLCITGEQIAAKGYSGGPDYYVRYNNKAFVFESKDSLINAALKETGNFTDLLEDLRIKFYQDGTSPKAVKQLINVITDLTSKRFEEIDPDYKADHLRVFPIVVIHDRQLDVPGFDKILNIWFSAELAELGKKFDVSRVSPVTLIDTTTLVLIHELLNSRMLMLEDLIVQYHEFTTFKKHYRSEKELMQHAGDVHLPFSFFVKQVIREKKLKRYPERMLKEKSFTALAEITEDSNPDPE